MNPNAIRIITVADVGRLTRHDPEAGQALRDEILDIAEADETKAIILRITGTEDGTSDGAVADARGGSRLRAYTGPIGLYPALAFCKKPVIAELRGRCHGAASLMTVCADLAVAEIDAAFVSPFDLLPEANFVLASLTIGLDRAKVWLLTGEAIDARQAAEIGLVNAAVPANRLSAAALALAAPIAAMPLDGITVSKMNVNACLDAMAVGQDFDMSGYFAGGMAAPSLLGVA